MCLGEGARNANKAAKRQYQYQLAQRERNWMTTLGITSIEQMHHEQTVDSSNVGLQNYYGSLQDQYGDLVGQARQADEENWKNYVKETGKRAASGQTGRSAARMDITDLGEYMAQGSRKAYLLTQAQEKLSQAGAQQAAQTRQLQMQSFANNNIIKSPDLAPPRPVMQNEGMAAFKDALSIASSIAGIASGIGSLSQGSTTNSLLKDILEGQKSGKKI